MQTTRHPGPDPRFELLEQLKNRGNAARNEMVEITIDLRNYADELRAYCRSHCRARKF